MAGFGNKVKTAVLKGMEAVGQSASNLATNAQQKLQELNLETQRREILSDFPLRAYDLWQKGEAMPEPLDKMLTELSQLDERLSVLRAQRYTHVDIPDGKQDEAAEEATEAAADAEADGDRPNGSVEAPPCDANETDGADRCGQPFSACATETAEAAPCQPEAADGGAAAPASEEAQAQPPMDQGETGDNA